MYLVVIYVRNMNIRNIAAKIYSNDSIIFKRFILKISHDNISLVSLDAACLDKIYSAV